MLAPLIKRVLESGLAGELNFHLGQAAEAGESNRRNGRQSKTVRTEYGAVEVETSRDRLGTFEPVLVGKRERQLGLGLEKQILGLYGLGMGHLSKLAPHHHNIAKRQAVEVPLHYF